MLDIGQWKIVIMII